MSKATDFILMSATRRYVRSEEIPGACIRSLTLAEWREWKFRPFDKDGNTDAAKLSQQDAALIQLTVCDVPADANGSIDDASLSFFPEQIPQIAMMDSGLASRLVEEIEAHLGFSDDVEDAKKNSETTQADCSPTD